jgi:hypothetical protein
MSDAIHLHVQAERCFRLARGNVGPKLADELEALGRVFRQEAMKMEASALPLVSVPCQRDPTLSEK